ncbi:Tyrosine-protein kinase HTK16 [Portunus trituberculatus]|uniref:Tyrosine-protein kinase HTK16 n=1 Tax=Portunus trituberculatus TaxID=210409 RepID=A0A5B7DMY5_PORTR|nr:Tyrosine-protein kinase HTK16 [Portunus trituberculatus]
MINEGEYPQGDMFCIDDGPYFISMETLVDHYMHFADGMPCRLQYPVGALPSPVADTASSRSPVFGYGNRKHWESDGGESSDMLLAASNSKTSCRASPLLHMDHLHHSGFPSQGSSHSLSKQEGASCEDDNPSSLERWPMLSVPSQEDLKPFHYRIQTSHEPDIIVTKERDPIDLNEPGATIYKEHKSNSVTQQKTPPPSKSSLKLDFQNLSISNSGESSSSPTMDGNRTDEIFGEIDINHLSIGECLGIGEFGSVLRGIWLSPSGDKIDVGVKTLHEDNKVNKKNFLKEAEVMMNLNHLYIVKLVGVCHGPPVAMVQELMAMGSLLDFLLEHEEEISVDFHHKLWAAQIAEGMMYLEQKHFVHCDLAARNILLSSMTLAKISDFGLSRALGVDKDYYTAKEGGKWPLKWYALESIYYGTFTHSSDVWSYGVTLWEMYTFGDQPYGEIPGKDVVAMLERNERLPQPEKCPKRVYDLMLRCWSYKPKKRPAFRELAANFRTQPEYINIKPYFK